MYMVGGLNIFKSKSEKLENKQDRQENRLERKQDRIERKQERINEYKKKQEETVKKLNTAKQYEAQEKKNEEAVMVGKLIEGGMYDVAIDDLLNTKEDGKEIGLEKDEKKLKAVIEDRFEQNTALNNATPEQLNGLKDELIKRIQIIRQSGNEKVEQAKAEDYTQTSRQIERSGNKDTRKNERKLVRLLRQVQYRLDNPNNTTT